MRRVLLIASFIALVVWPAASAHAQTAAEYFTPEEIARAEAFWSRAYPLAFAGLGLGLIVAAALGLGRGSRALNTWVRARWRRRWARAFVLMVIVVGTPAVAALPIFAGRHQNRRAFGLATNTAGEALRDHAVGLAFEFGIGLAGLVVLLAIARRAPRGWPAIVAPLFAAGTVVLVVVFPLVVEPAFNRFVDADAATAARVRAIAARASITVDEVLVADASRRTTTLNAYVSGLGSTKRVVLYDTLLEELPPEELDVVVAHELGHEASSDVLRGTALGVAGVVLAVLVAWLFIRSARFLAWIGADGPGDPALIPFLALFLSVAMLVATPVASAVSRRFEADADRFALRLTNPQAMVDLQVRLARENLSDLTPPPWIRWAFFTHPSTLERIRIAAGAR